MAGLCPLVKRARWPTQVKLRSESRPNTRLTSGTISDLKQQRTKSRPDNTKVVCKICEAEVSYCRNTTNLRNHLTRYHTMLTLASDNKPSGAKQKKPRESLTFPADSPRAIKITEAIATFVCKDLRPYSVVENEGFKQLVHVLDPHYVMVQRKHLTETVIPMMYTCVKEFILTKMQSAERVGIICDTWTSMSTQSYLTVNAHYIDNEWCVMSHVLQTTEVLTSHTQTVLPGGKCSIIVPEPYNCRILKEIIVHPS